MINDSMSDGSAAWYSAFAALCVGAGLWNKAVGITDNDYSNPPSPHRQARAGFVWLLSVV
jgi:hypothetical protein